MSQDARPMDVVEIAWLDSISHGGWAPAAMYREERSHPPTIRTVGYLLCGHKGGHYVLIQSVSSSGNVADSMTIPRRAVQSVTVLRKHGSGAA